MTTRLYLTLIFIAVVFAKILLADLAVLLSAISPTPPNTRRYPLSYVLSGGFSFAGGYTAAQGEYGYYSSVTPYDSDSAYGLMVNTGGVFSHTAGRSGGWALRKFSRE